jgi:type I restriction enzyme S subunit
VLIKHIYRERIEKLTNVKDKLKLESLYQDINSVYTPNIDIPNSWLMCHINHIGNVHNGSTPSRKCTEYWEGNIPWVSSGEVSNNIITKTREHITDLGYKNSSVRMLPAGTVLLAMIGEGKTRCQTSILNIEGTINQNVAAIVIDHGLVLSKYLWYWFQYQYEFNRNVGSGSGPKALNCQRVKELNFILPPLEEQQEIVCRVEALFKKADAIEQRYLKAKAYIDKLTQSILAKAFRGELVPQDPNDEPAEVLLERIRQEKAQQQKTTKAKAKTSKKGDKKSNSNQTSLF